jgi:alpha-2-macroglobulin
VATPQRQSQFYRRVPAAILVALSLLLPWAVSGASTPAGPVSMQLAQADTAASDAATTDAESAQADDAQGNRAAAHSASAAAAASGPVEPSSLVSGYQPVEGAPFFLLADSGFTSDTVARVRVEGDPSVFDAYDGVDVVVYRVPKPLDFLEHQKDLHRIQVNGDYSGEGLANTISFLWDKWFKKSRMIFQQIFTGDARQSVINAAPSMTQTAPNYPTRFHAAPQYRVLKQFEMVERFRYPVTQAKPIEAPAAVKLAGSSSDFIQPSQGNVYVPLGKLKPGLYFVEAYVGAHRATTLVFVSNTVAITKTAGKSMLVWATDRMSGKPAADVDIVWSDGNGVLKSDHTDDDGILGFSRDVPEKSYTLGQDKDGGVFVSENFYYDSEIYNSKLYLFTDRPLYKPGDKIQLKVYGREFTGARDSKPIEPAKVVLKLVDPAGQVLLSRPLQINADTGGDTELSLPSNAYPGGYDLHFDYRGATYSAMFRVADYAKPAFDVSIRLDRDDIHVGEPVTGQVELHYPNGNPVTDASVSLDLKSQALSVTNGDPEFGARFPQKLAQSTLHVDAQGIARFSLPAAAVPSRYLLQAVASEHNIFPVSANRELIMQPAPPRYVLKPAQTGMGAGKPVTFSLQGMPASAAAAAVSWEAIRLEDRNRVRGSLSSGKTSFDIVFPGPGAYNIFARGQNGELLGQSSYSIAAPAAKTLAGAIVIEVDKPRYQAGEVAHVRVVFPEPVVNALLTLERDQVEHRALLTHADDWIKLTQKSPTEWLADIPVKEDYGPNITFSALYVKNGDFNFQNAGIQVVVPSIDLAIHTDKSDYRPGDKVTVDLTSSIAGKPVAAVLSAGVVDDMVYTLQPEVAPSIFDFFYHPRRDSVRTTASLNFYGYDLAWSPHTSSEAKFDYNQRALKILTRPRRENIDTAAWQPTLKTDDKGHVSFSFTMPDSLSRWRITVRATTADGVVGQHTASITSSKPVYLRWSGPTRFRVGDVPQVGLIVFNEKRTPVAATLKVDGIQTDRPSRDLTLKPGDNFVDLPLTVTQDAQVDLQLTGSDGAALDRLRIPLTVDATTWTAPQSKLIHAGDALQLPTDALDIRLQAASGTQQAFGPVIDSLIDYPYGCVEQTASQMIPLTIALDGLPDDAPDRSLRDTLEQRLETARGRLMSMAGPKAEFAWWGDQTGGDPLLTTYAYYADWRATQRLGITLPPEHWQHVFDTYQASSSTMSVVDRALTLWLMQQMHLPVRTLALGVQHALAAQKEPVVVAAAPAGTTAGFDRSILLSNPIARIRWQMSLLLWHDIVRHEQMPDDPALAAKADAARAELQSSPNPMLAALAYGLGGKPAAPVIADLVNRFDETMPTMDRALALVWLQAAVQPSAPAAATRNWALTNGWRYTDSAGGGYWTYHGTQAMPLPASLQFSKAPAATQTFRLSYQSAASGAGDLPVTVTRRLYRLTPTAKAGVFAVTKAQNVLSANALYVDEIEIAPQGDKQSYRYGLLEVPVPAGAEIESQRFGFEIDGLSPLAKPKTDEKGAQEATGADASTTDGDTASSGDADAPQAENGDPLLTSEGVLSADKIQQFSNHYAVPVAKLDGKLVIRHLIRLGEAGRFVLPAARYYRMYDPSSKAFDAAGPTAWTVQ